MRNDINVIFITIDALRADHLNLLGYERDTTPEMEQIGRRSLVFSEAVSQSPHTPGSFPSLFSSTYPLQYKGEGSVAGRPIISSKLRKAGLKTSGIHSNPYLSRAYGFDRGFDRFEDGIGWSGNRLVVFLKRAFNYFFKTRPYMPASKTTKKAISWMENLDSQENIFLWVHYMDPHGPYQPSTGKERLFLDRDISPSEAKKLWKRTVDRPESISSEELRILVDLYDEEIAGVDSSIGELWNYLVDSGLGEDTLVILTADHGEQFREHGKFNHPRQLYDELIRVPLILYGPGIQEGKKVDNQVRTIDIIPTIAEVLEIDRDPLWEGKSLLELADEKVPKVDAISEVTGEDDEEGTLRFSIRRPDYKYILSIREDGKEEEEFYDLSADPGEQDDLLKKEDGFDREVLVEMAETLRDHMNDLYGISGDNLDRMGDILPQSSGESGETSSKEDREVRDRLEDLGYLD